jgi:hypothetical protein
MPYAVALGSSCCRLGTSSLRVCTADVDGKSQVPHREIAKGRSAHQGIRCRRATRVCLATFPAATGGRERRRGGLVEACNGRPVRPDGGRTGAEGRGLLAVAAR